VIWKETETGIGSSRTRLFGAKHVRLGFSVISLDFVASLHQRNGMLRVLSEKTVYSLDASFHFSRISLLSPILKDILSSIEDWVLNGNMLSSAKSSGT